MNLQKLRKAVSSERYEWRKHVLERLAERGIGQASVLTVLKTGEVIEDYPDDTPYPSVLVLGWTEGRSIHSVAAFDEENEWVYIITAYEPDLDHFESDYRTRRTT